MTTIVVHVIADGSALELAGGSITARVQGTLLWCTTVALLSFLSDTIATDIDLERLDRLG